MKREVFITLTLTNGDAIVVHQIKGSDLMNANTKAGTDTANAIYYIMCEVCTVNGTQMTMDYVLNLDVYDIFQLQDAVGAQLNKVK